MRLTTLLRVWLLVSLLLLHCSLSRAYDEDLLVDDDFGLEATDDNDCIAEDTSVTASVSTQFINKLASAFSPRVDSQLTNFTIPPQKVPRGSTGEIGINHFYLEGLSVQTAFPSDDEVTLQISDLSFNVEESNFTIVSGLTCSGVFWGEVPPMDVNISTRFSLSPDHKVVMEVTNSSFMWGDVVLHHKLLGSMCHIAESIVTVFLGNLDEYVVRKIKEEVPLQFPLMLQEQLQPLLEKAPLPVSAGPFITKDTVTIEFQLLDPTQVDRTRHNRDRKMYLSTAAQLAEKKDVSLILPERSLQHRIDYAFCRKRLEFHEMLPQQWNSALFQNVFQVAYQLCNDCPLEVSLESERPWKVLFNDRSIDLQLGGVRLGAYMVSKTLHQAREIHRAIFAVENKLPKGRVWTTGDFAAPAPLQENTKIPIALIRLNGRVEVNDLEGVQSKVLFHVDLLDDFDVELLELNVNGISEKDIRRMMMAALNFGILIQANKASPYELPKYISEVDIDLNQGFLAASSYITISQLLRALDGLDLNDG